MHKAPVGMVGWYLGKKHYAEPAPRQVFNDLDLQDKKITEYFWFLTNFKYTLGRDDDLHATTSVIIFQRLNKNDEVKKYI